MKTLMLLGFMAMVMVAGSRPVWAATPRVVVTVSLSKSRFTIRKASRLGTKELSGPIVPVSRNSVRPGTYYPSMTYQRYWTHNGNVVLDNVITFGKNGNIRTSRMFTEWVNSRRPATGSIVLEPDLGSILYQTIRTYGAKQTVIKIVR